MSLTLLLLFACRNNSHLLFRQCRERDFFIFGAFGNSLPLCHNVCHIAFAGFHFRWIFIVIIHTICILNLFHSKPYVRTSKLFLGGIKTIVIVLLVSLASLSRREVLIRCLVAVWLFTLSELFTQRTELGKQCDVERVQLIMAPRPYSMIKSPNGIELLPSQHDCESFRLKHQFVCYSHFSLNYAQRVFFSS